MAQETVTEYKTVEEQKTRTLCDNCNRTDEEEDILTVAINPQERVKESQNLELIKTFDDEMEAHRFINNKKEAVRMDSSSRIDTLDNEVWGVGWNHNTKTIDMKASATADLCASCVFDLFGIEIPEDEEVENINLGETEVNIDTTKQVATVWPQIDIPEWGGVGVDFGWKGKILLWPLMSFWSFIDILFDHYEGKEERQKGYVAGSLGAILWTAVTLTALYLTSFIVFAV